MKMASAFVLVLFMTGGGVSTYAYASPEVNVDSPLFPIKEGIEQVELSLALTPEGKCDVHLKRAVRRMEEAEVLRKRLSNGNGKLSRRQETLRKTIERMEASLDSSIDSAANEFETERAEKILNRLETNLESVEAKLGKIGETKGVQNAYELHQRVRFAEGSTQKRLVRIRFARNKIREARQLKRPRIHLRILRDGQTSQTGETVFPTRQ